jgi:hypothetical protein
MDYDDRIGGVVRCFLEAITLCSAQKRNGSQRRPFQVERRAFHIKNILMQAERKAFCMTKIPIQRERKAFHLTQIPI